MTNETPLIISPVAGLGSLLSMNNFPASQVTRVSLVSLARRTDVQLSAQSIPCQFPHSQAIFIFVFYRLRTQCSL